MAFAATLLIAVSWAGILSGAATWLVNDDFAMESMSAGQFSGVPESHLIFIKQSIGIPLTLMYSVWPGTPWYALALLATVFLSFFFLSFLARTAALKIGWVLFVVPVTIWLALSPNFTATAFLAGACALIFLSVSLSSTNPWRWTLASCILAALSVSWRQDAFTTSILILSPVFAVGLLRFWKSKNRKYLALLPIAIFGLMLVLLSILNLKCIPIGSGDCTSWAAYMNFNAIRGSFQGAPRALGLDSYADGVGWTVSAVRLFDNFAYANSSVFDYQHLRLFDDSIPGVLAIQQNRIVQHIFIQLRLFGPMIALLISVGLAVFVSPMLKKSSRKSFVFGVISTFLAFLGVVFIISLVRLPEPVVIGATVALIASWFAFGYWSWRDNENNHQSENDPQIVRRVQVSVSICGILALLIGIWNLFEGPKAVAALTEVGFAKQLHMKKDTLAIAKLAAGKPVFGTGYSSVLVSDYPYATGGNGISQGPLFGGWPVFAPSWEARRASLGFSDDVYTDLAPKKGMTSPDAVFLGMAYEADLTATFMNTQLKIQPQVTARKIGDLNSVLGLWQFTSAPS